MTKFPLLSGLGDKTIGKRERSTRSRTAFFTAIITAPTIYSSSTSTLRRKKKQATIHTVTSMKNVLEKKKTREKLRTKQFSVVQIKKKGKMMVKVNTKAKSVQRKAFEETSYE